MPTPWPTARRRGRRPRRRLPLPTPSKDLLRAPASRWRTPKRTPTCTRKGSPRFTTSIEYKVIVTFAAYRRRLQSSGDVVVSYQVLYASAAAATAAANAASSHTASTYQSAVQSAASEQRSQRCFRLDDRPSRDDANRNGDDAAANAASAVVVGWRRRRGAAAASWSSRSRSSLPWS